MKKESVNSFTEGISYDLSPLTTPNNILTDCVNGTFITFNGDELSLQNDAGNVKINAVYPTSELYVLANTYNNGQIVYTESEGVRTHYKNISGVKNDSSGLEITTSWEELSATDVQLSDGFYPIGIKEYGGVLYIISAKKPTIVPIDFTSVSSYIQDSVYYLITAGIKAYYKCKQSNTDDSLPFETNANWEYIGLERDFINYYGEVEFGSYPSPEAGGPTATAGEDIEYNSVIIESDDRYLDKVIYKNKVLNNTIFKTGGYITFDSDPEIINDFISYYNGDTYTPQFYKIKLLHQLENGYLDLTDDVWEKYAAYKGTLNSTTFWFNDPTFKYYCTSQFKGNLIMRLEIEDLTTFRVPSIPIVRIGTGFYEYWIDFIVQAQGVGDITIPNVQTEVWVEDFEQGDYIINPVTSNLAEYSIGVLPHEIKSQANYRITPKIYVGGVDITDDIPEEYLTNYVLEGAVLLTTEEDNIGFKSDGFKTNYDCDLETGNKYYNEIVLTNEAGAPIDETLVETATPHVFLRNGATKTEPNILLGVFEDQSGDNVIINSLNPDLPKYVSTEFRKYITTEQSLDCTSVIITISIVGYISAAYVFIMQGGERINPFYFDYGQGDDFQKLCTFKFHVTPINSFGDNLFSWNLNDPAYESAISSDFKIDSETNIIYTEFDVEVPLATLLTFQHTLEDKTIILTIEPNISINELDPESSYEGEDITIDNSDSTRYVRIIQDGIQLPVIKTGNKQYKVNIRPNIEYYIRIQTQGFYSTDYTGTSSVEETLKFGLISEVTSRIVQEVVRDGRGGTYPVNNMHTLWEVFRVLPSNVSLVYYNTAEAVNDVLRLVWNDRLVPIYQQIKELETNDSELPTYVNNVRILGATLTSALGYVNIPTESLGDYVVLLLGDDYYIFLKDLPIERLE